MNPPTKVDVFPPCSTTSAIQVVFPMNSNEICWVFRIQKITAELRQEQRCAQRETWHRWRDMFWSHIMGISWGYTWVCSFKAPKMAFSPAKTGIYLGWYTGDVMNFVWTWWVYHGLPPDIWHVWCGHDDKPGNGASVWLADPQTDDLDGPWTLEIKQRLVKPRKVIYKR